MSWVHLNLRRFKSNFWSVYKSVTSLLYQTMFRAEPTSHGCPKLVVPNLWSPAELQDMGNGLFSFLLLLALILRSWFSTNRFNQFFCQDVVHIVWLSAMTELVKFPDSSTVAGVRKINVFRFSDWYLPYILFQSCILPILR